MSDWLDEGRALLKRARELDKADDPEAYFAWSDFNSWVREAGSDLLGEVERLEDRVELGVRRISLFADQLKACVNRFMEVGVLSGDPEVISLCSRTLLEVRAAIEEAVPE